MRPDPFSRLAGNRLDKTVGLEDPRVREAVVNGAALATGADQPGAAKDGEVLTHVRNLATNLPGQVADRELTSGEAFEDAQPLWVGQGSTDRGKAHALGF